MQHPRHYAALAVEAEQHGRPLVAAEHWEDAAWASITGSKKQQYLQRAEALREEAKHAVQRD